MNLVGEVFEISLKHIKEIIDCQTIIGTTITLSDNRSIIPISRCKSTFLSGGSNLNFESGDKPFAGANVGNVLIEPVCFIVISDVDVKILHANEKISVVERLIEEVPDVVDKLTKEFKVKSNEVKS